MSVLSPKQSVSPAPPDMFLFWGCFVSLTATAFAFILRSLLIPVAKNLASPTPSKANSQASGYGLSRSPSCFSASFSIVSGLATR